MENYFTSLVKIKKCSKTKPLWAHTQVTTQGIPKLKSGVWAWVLLGYGMGNTVNLDRVTGSCLMKRTQCIVAIDEFQAIND